MALLRKFFKFQQHFVAGPPHFHIGGGNIQKRTILRPFEATFSRTKSRLKKQKNK